MSNAFRARGHECFTVDWDEQFPSSLHIDILQLTAQMILEKFGKPDIAWIGTDCSSYSVAAIGHHRKKNPITGVLEPKTEKAKKADDVNRHVLSLIKQLNPHFFFIENPVGGLRKMDYMMGIPRYTTTWCLAGETRIITKRGTFEIARLDGETVPLLTFGGKWVDAPIRCYGEANLYEIVLSRAKKKKVIRATGNHRWFTNMGIVETKDLANGVLLDYAQLPEQPHFELLDDWIARGFVFGDGWVLKRGVKKAFALFCNEKIEMMRFFKNYHNWVDHCRGDEVPKAYGMPREWKTEKPSLERKPSELFSWLAGYLAADGSVSTRNGQVTLSSSKKEDMEYVRDLCRVIGIETYSINSFLRKGRGKEMSYIYQMTFMKSSLCSELFIRAKHIRDYKKFSIPKHQPLRWSVQSVRNLNVIEKVYCAEVPETNAFALEDGIMTHNCQYGFKYRKATDIWTNHPCPNLRPPCHNGDPCHEAAPRGSKTGLQGVDGARDRSKYPPLFCEHIVDICERYFDSEPKSVKIGMTLTTRDLFEL